MEVQKISSYNQQANVSAAKAMSSAITSNENSSGQSGSTPAYSVSLGGSEQTSATYKMPAKAQAMMDEVMGKYSDMQSSVNRLLTAQGKRSAVADPIEDLIKNRGSIQVSDADRAKAAAEIAPGGYWSADATSSRILDFAKAISGDDPEKADKLREAFEKGYNEVAKMFGGAENMPQVSKDTFKLVQEGFDKWQQSKKTTNTTDVAAA